MEEENEQKKTKFSSPLPFLIRLKNFVFGKIEPDVFTKVTFYINLLIWTSFMFWTSISYLTITSRNFILKEKGIPVESIIKTRGEQLGFDPEDFLSRLQAVHGIGILCWVIVFIGLVLLYRKKKNFIYFLLTGVLFYLGMNIFYLNYVYFIEDTTSYDKISLLILLVSSLIHSFMLKNERKGGSISFFGEPQAEEET